MLGSSGPPRIPKEFARIVKSLKKGFLEAGQLSGELPKLAR